MGILLYKADFTSLTPQEAFDYLMSAEDTRNVMLLQDFFVCAAAVDGEYFTLLLTSFPTW